MSAPLTSFEVSLVEGQARELLRNGATKPASDVAAGQALLKLLEAYAAAQRVPPAEERAAWDGAYAAALSYRGPLPVEAAICADKAIEQRRERFGGGR